jgi:hypothetical protein
MSLEFYALPEEQVAWLTGVLAIEDVWCVAVRRNRPKGDVTIIVRGQDLAGVSFEVDNPSHLMFYLGLCSLGDPSLVESHHRSMQEFTKTLSVRLEASTIVQGRILLEGQLAIGQRWAYEKAGLDSEPLGRWFRRLRRSLAKVMSKDWVVGGFREDGSVYKWSAAITPGAVAWRQEGKLLKQTSRSTVEHEVFKKSSLKS